MKRKASRGTYRLTFSNGRQIVLGNNYKPWWQHSVEYIYRNYGNSEHGWRYDDIEKIVPIVEHSNQLFCDDGGLKWCSWETYQQIIDKVIIDMKLAPFKASRMIFEEDVDERAVLIKKLKEY